MDKDGNVTRAFFSFSLAFFLYTIGAEIAAAVIAGGGAASCGLIVQKVLQRKEVN